MRLCGLAESGRGCRRIEDCLWEGALTFNRETDDFGFLDRALGSLLGRCDNEIADATPLNLRRSPDDRQCVGGDARLNAGGADRCLGHVQLLLCIKMYGNSPDNARGILFSSPRTRISSYLTARRRPGNSTINAPVPRGLGCEGPGLRAWGNRTRARLCEGASLCCRFGNRDSCRAAASQWTACMGRLR